MRFIALCVAGLMVTATPASAQMGGMGGMGGGGAEMGAPAGGGDEAPAEDGDHAGSERMHGMKPISREKFDRVAAALFASADTNRDGMVTLSELQAIIDARRDAVVRDRFRDIDANHDGRIDLDEFIAWQKDMGGVAASDCSAYVGQGQIVPDRLEPELGQSEQDDALRVAIDPLSAVSITKANVHYRPGVTLDDFIAYENKRFDAIDINRDGFLEHEEVEAVRQMPGGRMRQGPPRGP